jgi:pimeloyl-ACP methyl ester carboxylesterase
MPDIKPGMTKQCESRSMLRISAKALAAAALLLFPLISATAQAPREPYGIGLEGFPYPYPVNMLPLVNDGEPVRMAYMDVAPAQPNGRTVVLLHGRNFPSSYWAPVIKTLTEAGFRVVVPDQIGFGKSTKPAGELHFDNLARNTIALLDHLGIDKVDIVAHSMGGMVGVRITRAYPDRVAHLLLTAPIGLEDYRLYVPPLIKQPVLFIMGADDHNAPGRPNAPEELRPLMGRNADLARALAARMSNARAEVIPDTGHLAFLEARAKFDELMLGFLGK